MSASDSVVMLWIYFISPSLFLFNDTVSTKLLSLEAVCAPYLSSELFQVATVIER